MWNENMTGEICHAGAGPPRWPHSQGTPGNGKGPPRIGMQPGADTAGKAGHGTDGHFSLWERHRNQ